MKTIHLKHRNTMLALFSLIAIASVTTACTTSDTSPVSTMPTATALAVEALSVDEAADENTADFTVVDEEGSTEINNDALHEHILQNPDAVLTDVEIEGLLFMREEEKLARDVYLTLYDLWQMNIFRNISRSEQTHADAVKVLLDQFGLEDPMSSDVVGVFENQDLQALYDSLIATGSQSLRDALLVGAAIEEIDILDLEEYINQTSNVDIQLVYENLTKGSRNHLRSFVSVFEKQTGETYLPQYMSEEAFQLIIDAAMESGGQGGRNQTP
ncbi:MAG: DUF2202 domain-containing protein [Anaerolineae bacterium]|jgi:hypothetical protein|nr:DUF2202 domain-containing protein [Anaerolineae bacterium]